MVSENSSMTLPGLETVLVRERGIPRWLWQSKRVPFGDISKSIQIYDVNFHLTGLTEAILPHLEHLDMGPAAIPVIEDHTINVWKSPHPQFNNLTLSGTDYVVKFRRRGAILDFYGYYFAATANLVSGSIDFFLADAQPACLGGEIDNFLRVASSLFFRHRKIYMFHSGAVHIDGQTFVFFGPHGAGKSTLSLMAPSGACVLGDDLNALRCDDNGRLFVASLPFPSEMMKKRPIVEYPVTALLRLCKDDHFAFEPMSPVEKLAAMIGSLPVLTWVSDPSHIDTDTVNRILAAAPLCRFHFSKDKEVYTWLRENLDSIPR